jgi:hypothetical protein
VVVGPFALSPLGREPGLALVIAAGAGDAWAAFAAKLVVDELSRRTWTAALAWGVGAGLALGAGVLAEMTALQRYRATRVGPMVVVMQIAIPVLLAPLVGGEGWGGTPLGGAVLVGALGVAVGGVATLASSPVVAGVIAEQHGGG